LLSPDVIFLDFGGTIADQTNTREEAVAASLAMLGHSRPMPDIATAVAGAKESVAGRWSNGMSFRAREDFFIGLYQAAAETLGFGVDSRAIGRHLWNTQQDSYSLYDDVLPALQLLRGQGARLGIISNWDKLNLADVCRDLGIAQWFDVILPSAEAGADKPDPHIFRRALEMAHAEAHSCVHVGDSYGADVTGARGVGMIGILVQRDGPASFDCPTVRGLGELPELLHSL
jgi:HAD superfamily hydrolase (TIGR01662 family)